MEKQDINIFCIFQENQENFQKLLEKIFIEYLQEKNV